MSAGAILIHATSSMGSSKRPIEFLPPELLVLIFCEVMTLHRRNRIAFFPTSQKREQEKNEVDTAPLHTLTHVCRYWRELALGTPALWTRIHRRCHDQMEAFLERSQPMNATLFLSVDHLGAELQGLPPPRMASMIKAHAGRLRRLNLFVVPTLRHLAPLLMSLRAPQLEVLTIATPYRLCSPGILDTDNFTREPLLDREASALRALAMVTVMNWMPSCTLFPNLTHLVLFFHRLVWMCHPFDLLELFSNAPALEFVHIDFLLGDEAYSGNWRPPSDPVPLPRLRSLLFTCSYSVLVSGVLSHLSLPEDVLVRIPDVYGFGLDFSAHFGPLSLGPVTSLDLSLRSEQILMVADGPESGLWFEGHLCDPQEPPLPARTWEAWLVVLQECLTLTHVTHLHIYMDPAHSFWPEFLAKLPQPPTHRPRSSAEGAGQRRFA